MRHIDTKQMTVPELKIRLNKINKDFTIDKSLEDLKTLQEQSKEIKQLLDEKIGDFESQILKDAMDKYIKNSNKITLYGFIDFMKQNKPRGIEFSINYLSLVPKLKENNLLPILLEHRNENAKKKLKAQIEALQKQLLAL